MCSNCKDKMLFSSGNSTMRFYLFLLLIFPPQPNGEAGVTEWLYKALLLAGLKPWQRERRSGG